MTPVRFSESAVRLMIEEAGLLERVGALEQKLKKHVVDRNWKGLDQTIRKIEPLARRAQEIETERTSAFERLREAAGAPEEAGFYQVVVLLPSGEREEAAAAYRALKMATLELQGITRGIDAYLSTMSGTLHEVLEELYPFRRGKIYSGKGHARPVEANPMLISRKL